MKNRLLVSYSSILFLLALVVISTASSSAVASRALETGTAGEHLRILISPDRQTLIRGNSASFTIIVINTSEEVNLTNVVVKDLFAPDCNRNIGNLPASSNFPPYKCAQNNVQEPMVNWITVEGTNPVNEEIDIASDSAEIDIIDIAVSVSADPTGVQSPGGNIEFSVLTRNNGSVPVILKSITSPQYGDLTDPTNQSIRNNNCVPIPNLPLLPSDGGEFVCSFIVALFGDAGQFPVEIRVEAEDGDKNATSSSDTTFVSIDAAIKHAAYFPMIVDNQDEPNNSCETAYPLQLDQVYHFLPNDNDDWYHFTLQQKRNVLVELTKFVPRFGQIIVYEGGRCDSLHVLKNNGNNLVTKLVPLGVQPPGRYHILVINDGDPNADEPYQLQIKSR